MILKKHTEFHAIFERNVLYFLYYHYVNYFTNDILYIITMAEISILIENKYLGGEHKVITLKQQFLGLILWFSMYLKWQWLLRLFA